MRTSTLIAVCAACLARDAVCADEPALPPAGGVTTLAQEREEIAVEIELEVLYELDQAKAATALLRQTPKEWTPARNVEDAMAAFAMVDERFAAAGRLLQEKKFEEAAEAFRRLPSPTSRTYFAAAAHWGRLWALQQIAAAQKLRDAVSDAEITATDAAAAFASEFSDRPSFALRAYELAIAGYEKEARLFYAYKNYIGYLETAERLGWSDTAEARRVQARVAQLAEDLRDPVNAIGRLMGESRELLEGAQTGTPAQEKQREVVAWLDDLIQTLEERQTQSRQPPQPRARRPTEGQPKIGEAPEASVPRGGQRPRGPASGGYTTEGDGRRIGEQDVVHPSDRSDEWARLPPAEREKFLQQLKERFPDRYEEILKEYFRELAEDRAPAAARGQPIR